MRSPPSSVCVIFCIEKVEANLGLYSGSRPIQIVLRLRKIGPSLPLTLSRLDVNLKNKAPPISLLKLSLQQLLMGNCSTLKFAYVAAGAGPSCLPPACGCVVKKNWNAKDGSQESQMEYFLSKTNRFVSLQAVDSPYLDKILAKPLLSLKNLDIISSGSEEYIQCLATTKLGHLTKLHFEIYPKSNITPGLGDILLDFLQGCLQLKVAFFGYLPYESTAEEKSTKIVSLPRLCSFTHKSPDETFHIGLFNQLSLPTTCDTTFTITHLSKPLGDLWESFSGFPKPSVQMTEVNVSYSDESHVLRVNFSKTCHMGQISFNAIMNPRTSIFSGEDTTKFLDLLTKSKVACKNSMLQLHYCKAFPYGDVVSWIHNYVVSKKHCETSVYSVNLIFEEGEGLPHEDLVDDLKDCVGSGRFTFGSPGMKGKSPRMKGKSPG